MSPARVAIATVTLGLLLCAEQRRGGSQESAERKIFLDERCGFKFTYPTIWAVARSASSSIHMPCDYELTFTRRLRSGNVIKHRVSVFVEDHDFAGLEKEDPDLIRERQVGDEPQSWVG
jgi:hypothetical protein